MRWTLLLAIPPLLWALLPALDALRRPRIEILLDQLAGRGCQFQPHARSLNPLTTYGIRHPEYVCPIWAAEHLAGTPAADRPRALAAIDAALLRLPATFDTGDGILPIAAQLKAARAAI
jgi:hypothetical protein